MKKKISNTNSDSSNQNPFYLRFKSLNRERLNIYNYRLFKRLTLYFDDDGNEVSDVLKASKDVFGRPVVSRLSKKDFIPVKLNSNRITFNPHDPLARQRAFSARVAFSELTSSPTDYRDNFDSIQYVNNVAEKVTSIVQSKNNE